MDLPTLLIVLASYLAIYFPEQLDPNLKPRDSSYLLESGQNLQFDFIIVGAGSAGCAVANRLSANPDWEVLLIEAGDDETYQSDTPALSGTLFGTKYHYNYTTTKQKHCCLNRGGHCSCDRGRVMGGTSTINGMMYVRGSAEGYDNWKEMGNPGWDYENVLPYFLKMENMTIPSLVGDTKYHNDKGPVTIGYPKYTFPINDDYIRAGIEYGLNEVDYNGKSQIGIGKMQYNARDSTRCSSSKAYLDPIRDRKNLYIFKNTLVTEILFNEETRTATGVNLIHNKAKFTVNANKEVIISAGAIDTPKLLMLSGVGPKEHLQQLGISSFVDLPVGKYLADHPGLVLYYKMNTTMMNCCGELTNDTILEYARDRSGGLTAEPWEVQAYFKANGLPNKPLVGMGLGVTKRINNTEKMGPRAQILINIMNPKSVGELKLKSADYRVDPDINPNYLSEESDLIALKWAIREAFKLMKTPSMLKYKPKLLVNNVRRCLKYYSPLHITDQFLECYIRYAGTASFHPVGTARMGTNPANSVVDAKLKVHNVKNLRVIDASVMPEISRGNTNAPCIMIGEKGADIIINSYAQ